MPISTAHPAIVLPFFRLPKHLISVSALIFGSIAPDLEYFYHLSPKRTYGHLWAHAWWFDGLIALGLCFVFHWFVRDVLIEYLPTPLYQRFATYKSFDWLAHCRKHFLAIVFSAILAIYLHLLWDAFTHKGMFFVDTFPILQTLLFEVSSYKVYIYKVLQHLSSLLGTLVILYSIWQLPRQKERSPSSKWYWYWLAVVGFSLLFLLITLLINETPLAISLNSFSKIIVTLMSGGFWGMLVVAVLFFLLRLK
ncbi:MAG: DUF4184 family protein [Bacteroidota bacterium]